MLHQLTPLPGQSFDLDNPLDRERVRASLDPGPRAWIRATMVTNSQGATTGKDSTSNSLSKGGDRTLLGVLRSLADGVVVGARTLEHERVPIPKSAALVILSRTGNIAWDNVVRTDDSAGKVIVLTTSQDRGIAHSGLEQKAEVVRMNDALDLPELTALIRESVGGGRLLIEGGRQVWEHFAPLCDDLWLAVAPPPVSGREGLPEWWPEGANAWDLSALYTDEARMLYYHHRATRGAP
jgi:riboflavin biosynthesis pyrimidine reductase